MQVITFIDEHLWKPLICKYYTIVSVCMCHIKLYKIGETVLYNFIRP